MTRGVGFAAFFLLGWTIVLIPSLIRDVEGAFRMSDAGMGLAYFAYSGVYVGGAFAAGFLTGRVGRRRVLPAGPALVAVGAAICAASAAWPVFVLGFMILGLGAGIIDSGINALFMDLFPTKRASALNRLHLWVAIGALAAPAAVGALSGLGLDWRIILLATAAGATTVGVGLAGVEMPLGRKRDRPTTGAVRDAPAVGPRVLIPLAALAVAIGCYIATETGITSWLVRFIDSAPVEVATLALSLFWGGLALGRLVSGFVADRLAPVRFAAGSAILCGASIVVAVAVPVLPVRLALFALAGLAAGPVYPLIMALGGSQYPDRTALVSSVLASSAIVGSVVYPPLVGVVSDTAGLAVGIFVAGLLSVASAVAITIAHRAGRAWVRAG